MKINLSYLEEITSGDKEMILEMIDLFIKDIPVHKAKLKEYHSTNSLDKLGAEAHKLKPTMQYIGLISVFEIVKEIEGSCKTKEGTDQLTDLIHKLETNLDNCMIALKKLRADFN